MNLRGSMCTLLLAASLFAAAARADDAALQGTYVLVPELVYRRAT